MIGPLVIAGLSLEVDKLRSLEAIGVKDSKLLSPSRRVHLASQIKIIATEVTYMVIHPREIDEIVTRGKKLYRLNYLEAKAMAEVIVKLHPDIAYVDASDVLEDRFKETIQGMIPFSVKIISEHYADKKYRIVSAASILAKVKRDELVEELKAKYGDFGSGYPADPKTKRFLSEWLKAHETYPDFVRKSWKTTKDLKKDAV